MVEATDPDTDRVNRSPANNRNQVVARLLEEQRSLDQRPMLAGQLDGAREAEEVRSVRT